MTDIEQQRFVESGRQLIEARKVAPDFDCEKAQMEEKV